MHETQDLGRAIRELLTEYTPPPDPYTLVAARVRVQRRRLVGTGIVVTVSLAFVVLASVTVVSLDEVAFRPVEAAAPPRPVAAGNQFAEFGADTALGPAYVVARGSVNGRAYVVASTTFGQRGAACLFAADAIFTRLSWCSTFAQHRTGQWDVLAEVRPDAGVIAIGGTVAADVQRVTIKTADGEVLAVPAVRTPTSSRVGFFVGVLPGAGKRVVEVVAVSAAGDMAQLVRSVPDGRCAGGQAPDPEPSGPVMGCSSNGSDSQ
jgi:hypothetical protein